jgi:hypothetical protein
LLVGNEQEALGVLLKLSPPGASRFSSRFGSSFEEPEAWTFYMFLKRKFITFTGIHLYLKGSSSSQGQAGLSKVRVKTLGKDLSNSRCN